MAKVVQFHEIGGPEVLKIEEVAVPAPGKDEVQIRVHALGLNRAESMFRSGQYLEEPKLPARLGYEAGPSPRLGRASRVSRSATRSARYRASR
jgi:NADPH:quinone reductase-like Zn-dependent oxidoreductase